MEPLAYLNGRFLPQSQAGIPLTDIGLLRGYGVMELLRMAGGRALHLEQHLDRLDRSAAALHLHVPISRPELLNAVERLVAANTDGSATVKIVLTGGPTVDGITFDPATPTLFILVAPFKPLPARQYEDGVALISREHQRPHWEIKSLNYLAAVQVQPQRLESGAFEALYHTGGELREAATSNIFLIRDDVLVTPDAGVLKGITRQAVLGLAAPHFAVQERTVAWEELFAADEVFLTATNKDLLPVVSVDGRPVGGGLAGKNTRHLLELYRKASGLLG